MNKKRNNDGAKDEWLKRLYKDDVSKRNEKKIRWIANIILLLLPI